ncbi:MAG TPA: hypothetical protein VII55_00460 [Candidatus Saccharimonadales bacterium]
MHRAPPTPDPDGEGVVWTGQTIDHLVLPTIREGETPTEFGPRAERDLLDILEGMGVEAAATIKTKLHVRDAVEGQPVRLATVAQIYEDQREATKEDVPDIVQHNKALQALSVTASTVVDIAALISSLSVTDPEDPIIERSISALGDKMMFEVHYKTPDSTHAALSLLLGQAMKTERSPHGPA